MVLHVFQSGKDLARAAAAIFAAQILKKPDSVLGLATGSTPLDTYSELIKLYEDKVLDFSMATSFNLDEYVQIPHDHPASYHDFMRENLFSHINMKDSFVPDGNAEDMDRECARYDAEIVLAGGIDLQLLGIGHNGHIGFNEPSDRFVYGTHVVELTQSTLKANLRFFEREDLVPRRAVSMGIGTIMSSKSIILLALGKEKAQAVYDMVRGEMTPRVQASILRVHPDVTVLLDSGAASLL